MTAYVPAVDRTFVRTLIVGIREFTEAPLIELDAAARKGWPSQLLTGYRALDSLDVGKVCTDLEGNQWMRNA